VFEQARDEEILPGVAEAEVVASRLLRQVAVDAHYAVRHKLCSDSRLFWLLFDRLDFLDRFLGHAPWWPADWALFGIRIMPSCGVHHAAAI
jgi:hypothetical protein